MFLYRDVSLNRGFNNMSQTQISAPYIIGMVDEAGLPVRNPNPADAFVQGYGQPGAIISIYQNGNLEGSAIADSNGTWQFRLTTLSNGSYTDVTATATAQNGPERHCERNVESLELHIR